MNGGDEAIVIRNGTDKWLLPAHESGLIFVTLGPPEEAPPTEYELLDATSCRLIAVQRVEWAVTPDLLIVIGADRVVQLATPGSSMGPQLESTDQCPGPADGWALWLVNTTARGYFIRSRDVSDVEVARVEPSSTAVAVGGGPTIGPATESSVIELLDDSCQVLDTQTRTGWGIFKGTIRAGPTLTIEKGVAPDPRIVSYDLVTRCHGS